MKKPIVVGVALALALAGCFGGKKEDTSSKADAPVVQEESADTKDAANEIAWIDASTANAAAKAAGFSRFGVMDQVKLNGTTFENPKFAAAGGVAQAYYENGAMGLFVRKAEGRHTAPLTDRTESEFAQKWTEAIDGVDVTMWGASKDAATVATWTDGAQEFGVTFQGLGGEEVTMTAAELTNIVKGFKSANGAGQNATDPDAAATEAADTAEGAEVAAAAEDAKADGTAADGTKADGTTATNGTGTTTGTNGSTDVTPADVKGLNPLTEADVKDVVAANDLGEVVKMQQWQGEDTVWYWEVTTKDSTGSEVTFYVDGAGGVIF